MMSDESKTHPHFFPRAQRGGDGHGGAEIAAGDCCRCRSPAPPSLATNGVTSSVHHGGNPLPGGLARSLRRGGCRCAGFGGRGWLQCSARACATCADVGDGPQIHSPATVCSSSVHTKHIHTLNTHINCTHTQRDIYTHTIYTYVLHTHVQTHYAEPTQCCIATSVRQVNMTNINAHVCVSCACVCVHCVCVC